MDTLKTTRRRVLALAAVLVPVLGFRRAVAGPELVVVEPVPLPVPEPVASPAAAMGLWRAPGGWAYHARLGWMHSMMPIEDLTPANWYGPPPLRDMDRRMVLNWDRYVCCVCVAQECTCGSTRGLMAQFYPEV